LPLEAWTVNRRLEAAAVTTRVLSSLVSAIPNGVATWSPDAGLEGGSGSRSWIVRGAAPGVQTGFSPPPQLQFPPLQSTSAIWFRNRRFSSTSRF
jgi:hypothetical protein